MPNILPFATHVKLVESLLSGSSPRGAAKEVKIDKDVVYRMLRRIGAGCDQMIAYAKTGLWRDPSSAPADKSDTLVMMAAIHCAWVLYVRQTESSTAAMGCGAAVRPLTVPQLVLLAISSVDGIRPTYTKRKRRYVRKTHVDDAVVDAYIFGTLGDTISGTRARPPPAASCAAGTPPTTSEDNAILADILVQRRKSREQLPNHISELLDD